MCTVDFGQEEIFDLHICVYCTANQILRQVDMPYGLDGENYAVSVYMCMVQ